MVVMVVVLQVLLLAIVVLGLEVLVILELDSIFFLNLFGYLIPFTIVPNLVVFLINLVFKFFVVFDLLVA